jgi:hypothetical protein
MPKMTREKFLSELQNRPVPQIHEKELGINQKALNEHARELAYKDARDFLRREGWRGDQLDDMADDMADENASQFIAEAHDELVNKYKHEFPWHEQHTLPGGDNYREMLIKAPGGRAPKPEKIIFKSQNDVDDFLTDMSAGGFEGMDYGRLDKENAVEFGRGIPNSVLGLIESNNGRLEKPREDTSNEFAGVGTHFGGEPGILASMRLKDRTGPNGEKLLHLEELQSDWHQQGREKGYRTQDVEKRRQELLKAASPYIDSNRAIPKEIYDELTSLPDNFAPPDAPFKKNWEEMALKRLIHHAAENGYHGIVVTPGAEQADRYSLAKHIDSIMLVPNPYPNKETRPYIFKAFDKAGNFVTDDTVDEAKLQEYIGKEPAKQLLSSPANPMGERMISGANIVTGDKAMKKFYDEKVPNILNSVGKKYGVKTQLGGHKIKINEGMLEPNPGGGYTQTPPETKSLHHFPITDEMRQDVLQNGLPLYAEGGEVHMAKGGSTIKNIQDYIRQREGEYGLKRLQRAADEIPHLERMYTEEALRRAFSGDNAKALMTMNPALFEKYSIPLLDPRNYDEDVFYDESPNGNLDQHIRHLARIKGGFEDVPFLEVGRRKPELLPSIEGHEGRHRSRALTKKKIQKSLVQLFPNYGMREGMPRRYREDFIEAMKKELGEKRLVTPEGRSLLPTDLTAMEHQNLERRGLLEANRPQLPEIYKDGGDVDPESCFFPKSKE